MATQPVFSNTVDYKETPIKGPRLNVSRAQTKLGPFKRPEQVPIEKMFPQLMEGYPQGTVWGNLRVGSQNGEMADLLRTNLGVREQGGR